MKISNNQIIESTKVNLEKILSNSFLLNKLNDEQFRELVIKQVSILNYYESQKKSKKNNKADVFLKKINEINSSNYSFININYSKIEDAYDDVNYLKTFINNVYKINIDENLNKNVDDNVIKAEPVFNNMNKNSFDQIGIPQMNGAFMSPEMFQEQWYRKLAYDQYYLEVMKGEFYQFKTKPKSIVFFKYLISALIILFVLSIIVKIIFQILVWDIKIKNSSGAFVPITIFGIGSISDIILIFFMCLILYRLIKPTKNDNVKYFFQWKFIMIIFVVMLVSFALNIPDLVKWYSKDLGWETYHENVQNNKVNNMNAFLILSFVSYGEFFLITIIIAIASVFNPKKDIDRINQKIESLYNEIKNGKKDVPVNW